MVKFARFYLDSFRGLSKEIWLLSLVTLINRSGAVVMLFLSIYLTEQLGFSKSEAGIALGFVGLGAVIGAYIGGWLTDRFGYYRVMFCSLFSVGFFFLGIIFIRDFYPFCLGILLTSIVGDIFRPASSAAITAYSKKENLSRSLSLYRIAINLGFAIGGGAAGILAGLFGYKWLFIVDGVTCMFAAFAFIYLLKEIKEIETEEEKLQPLVSAYKDYWYLFFLSFLFLNVIIFFQLFNSYPVFCREVLNFTEQEVGAQMTFNGLIICLIEMPLVAILTKYKKEMPAIIWGVLLIGLSFLIFNIFGFFAWVALLCMLLISVGEIINFPFAYTIALQRSTPRNRGQYMGLFSMMFSGAIIVAPWLGLYIAEQYSFTHLWYFMGVLSLVSTTGLLVLAKIRVSKQPIMENVLDA